MVLDKLILANRGNGSVLDKLFLFDREMGDS